MPAVARGEQLPQASKDAITEMALGLLQEQVEARIVHYKADLETNPELDAITAGVVAQLREMQQNAQLSERQADERPSIAQAHERTLRTLLGKVFRPDEPSVVVQKRLRKIHRKLARLFFESELHEKTRGQDGATKVIQLPEQALYYLLVRYEHRLKNELGGFDFANEEVKNASFELLARVAKDMQDTFLSRRSSELRRIVSAFNSVLVDFCSKHLASNVGQLSKEVIVQAATHEGRAFAYKVTVEAFPRFRAALERRLMVRLVGYAEDQLVARLADTSESTRPETLQFITDPRIFSMICGELCDELYEYLAHEGFLDVPTDYRESASSAT